MTGFLLKRQEDIIVTRGLDGLDDSRRIISEDLNLKVDESSFQAFEILTDLLYDKSANISEEEVQECYRNITLNLIKAKYGMKASGIAPIYVEEFSTLDSLLPELKQGNLTIATDSEPEIILDGDNIVIKNINVRFNYNSLYDEGTSFDVSAPIREMTFYDENRELFTYSMVAGQGIYITGKTSTILGNVYAGTHAPSEMRKAEALYGESGSFGGVNVMSTQVGIYADKIVTDGNVSMKGAFVVMGSDAQPMKVYAREIRQTDNIASKNIYALIGEVSGEDVSEIKNIVSEATAGFEKIDHFYDSDNDVTYTGKYRKIISSTDITVSNDVTGIIMTPGNVIIEEGVNVEGLIICGDRIYVQGNNNIVSSADILRRMLKEELYDDIYTDVDEEITLEEKSLASVHLFVKDYFGGITRRGIERDGFEEILERSREDEKGQ